MPDTDDILADIAAVLAGDRDRFRSLVERFERPVFSVVRSFVRDEGRAEDLAQETFVSAFTHLSSFDLGRGRFATWLYTIARNKCRDALRRGEPAVRPVTDRPAPAATVGSSDSQVRNALDALPPEQRMAFLLGDVFGLPYDDIAELEGIALGTVKSRVSRARERLREALAPLKETR